MMNKSLGNILAVVIANIVMVIITLFFGQHHGNTRDESVMNCLRDSGNVESCFNQ